MTREKVLGREGPLPDQEPPGEEVQGLTRCVSGGLHHPGKNRCFGQAEASAVTLLGFWLWPGRSGCLQPPQTAPCHTPLEAGLGGIAKSIAGYRP